jgi:DNA-binding MarR family transcriptional regulator
VISARRAKMLTKAEYEGLAAFRRALREFMVFSEHAARKAGLTPQQHQILLAIKGAPARDSLTVGEIAEALKIKPHSAVELVDRMAHLGLVERRTDPLDHRRVQVALTARGDHVLEALSAQHLNELRAIGPAVAALLQRFGPDEEQTP